MWKPTNLLSVPRVHTTFASHGFSVAAPLCGTRSHLAFVTLRLPGPILSVAFLKLTASSRPSAAPSDSCECLRFGHWLTLCTVSIHSFTCLTYLLCCFRYDMCGAVHSRPVVLPCRDPERHGLQLYWGKVRWLRQRRGGVRPTHP